MFTKFAWSRTLLESTPHELKFNLSQKSNTALEFLLKELTDDAMAILKADMPSGMTPALKLSDLYWASQEPSTFFLNEKQENAISVIMCAFGVENLLTELTDPERRCSETELAKLIATEMFQLAISATRGEFQSIQQFEEREHKQKFALRENLSRANKSKHENMERKRQLCCDLAKNQFKDVESQNQAAHLIRNFIQAKQLFSPIPSTRSIKIYIKDDFPRKKKTATSPVSR